MPARARSRSGRAGVRLVYWYGSGGAKALKIRHAGTPLSRVAASDLVAHENRRQMADTAPTTLVVPVGDRHVSIPSADLSIQRAALAPVAALLFCSGMCGLVVQVSWFREFRLLFGASTAASSAVLAVFMGGLGIGNAVLGGRADRARIPLALYARLELSIALAVAVGPVLIDVFHRLYISLGGQLALGFSMATAVRWRSRSLC